MFTDSCCNIIENHGKYNLVAAVVFVVIDPVVAVAVAAAAAAVTVVVGIVFKNFKNHCCFVAVYCFTCCYCNSFKLFG